MLWVLLDVNPSRDILYRNHWYEPIVSVGRRCVLRADVGGGES